MPTIAELCRDSINDHGATVCDCFAHAAENIAAGKLKREEADQVFLAMAKFAEKGTPPPWSLVAPLMLARLDDYYRSGGNVHGNRTGDRAVPGFTSLLGLLGTAANEGRQ